MRTTHIAFVPQWIRDKLAHKGLPLDTLLDFEKLAPIFSIEDLATIAAIEERSSVFSAYSVYSCKSRTLSYWQQTAKSERAKKLLGDIGAMLTEQFEKETLERLFIDETPVIEKNQKDTFDITFLGNEGMCVVLKQGHPLQSHVGNAPELFRKLIKSMLVFHEYHEVMETPLGKIYIESLLRQ